MEFKLGLLYNLGKIYRIEQMTVEEVERWFGNLNKACLALKIAPQNMTKWKRQDYIPWKQQFKLAVITEGELMPDDEDPFIIYNLKKMHRLENRK